MNKQLTKSNLNSVLASNHKNSQDYPDQQASPVEKKNVKIEESIQPLQGQDSREEQESPIQEKEEKQGRKKEDLEEKKEEEIWECQNQQDEVNQDPQDEQTEASQEHQNNQDEPDQEQQNKQDETSQEQSCKPIPVQPKPEEEKTENFDPEKIVQSLEEDLFQKHILLLDENQKNTFIQKLNLNYIRTNQERRVIKHRCPSVNWTNNPSLVEIIFTIYTLHQEKLKQIQTRPDYPIIPSKKPGQKEQDPHPLYIFSGLTEYQIIYTYFGKEGNQIGNCFFWCLSRKDWIKFDDRVVTFMKTHKFDFKVLQAVEICRRKISYEDEREKYYLVPVIIAAIIFSKMLERQADEEKKKELFNNMSGEYHVFTGTPEKRQENFHKLLKEYTSFFKVPSKNLKSTLEMHANEFFLSKTSTNDQRILSQ